MGTESLLYYEPTELSFLSELNKQLRSSLQLFNKTNDQVAFKLLTTNPRNYGVRPRTGIIMPGSDCMITVTMRAMKEVPPNMRCKDKFMIQTAIASHEDARMMFNREARHVFSECKLRVVFISPPTKVLSSSPPIEVTSSFPPTKVPSAVAENVAESSPGPSTIESGNLSEVINSHKEPEEDAAAIQKTSTMKLLHVHPRKRSPLKLKREQYCSFQLENLTKYHVAFMVKTTSSMYSAHPNVGIILPSSTYEIAVKMQEQSKDESEVQSEDKLVVHSLIAIPAAKVENFSPEMLGVSTIEECDLHVIQIPEQEKIIYHHAELLIKGFIACLLGLVSWYLMEQTLSLVCWYDKVFMVYNGKKCYKCVQQFESYYGHNHADDEDGEEVSLGVC